MGKKITDSKLPAKKKGGVDPRVFTEDEIALVKQLAGTLNQKQLADHFGICSTTFRDIKKRQPEVAVAYKKGRSKMIDDVANSLYQSAMNGNTAAAIFYLKTQAGWREKDRSEIEGDEDYNGPIPLLVVYEDPKDNMKEVKEVGDE